VDYQTIFAFIATTAVLAFSPGPDNIYVLMQSITNGTKYGLATVIGLLSGCLVHTTFVALGISAALKSNDFVYLLIKILGVLYLLYLAYRVFKSEAKAIINTPKKFPKKPLFSLYKQGFIMNLLNPKVSLFFLAFFPGFLFSDSMSITSQFFVLGFLFIITSMLVFSIIAILAGKIANYIQSHTKIGSLLKWAQILIFIGLAVFVFFSKK